MNIFHKIISWLLTPIFIFIFFITLCIFHVFQVISLNLFGYKGHKKSVDYMVFWLMQALRVLGARLPNMKQPNLPTDRPIIVVANHQSIYDVPAILWTFRKYHPKFVSKKELEYGTPAISYNLRHGGSVLIDRKDRKQSLTAMNQFSKYIAKNNYAGCIFPEGTRSKDGKMLDFKPAGMLMMFKSMKENPPIVVPVVIDNFWKIQRYYFKPIPFGINFQLKVLEPIDMKIWLEEGNSSTSLIAETEKRIKEALINKA
ncbi:1-acyl-sn-glycerol-3-phosphate acyltransferase [Bernardetia litoralis DSM 6794]|uniref:1-acyl-sn-glycerol-3-phosphate acyltransferase n=1 Tax=Bernardetia litoralis (strain ATCC 23117 / DSM 6794 / NBRC 15988 / NCIMB 1366 / Fx l1 / Sio-4) TaxID=880071 RepID=I4AQV7_BERLS|nr:lysophospholipid acyltransferase family protein [Bernardetia litoralis]AFM06342.1 1-acyl-sn-glycerol-3-phosphate acyltransferase [Bernardetia litoralis DSM 6794]